jgi:hypothetical protein
MMQEAGKMPILSRGVTDDICVASTVLTGGNLGLY